ncbi:uncharacterized protein AB675_5062 [Cyphellophora attinorum]|uniref:AB hydrolase-1 domain-containing protein n=1 Tax=Cyphellophora attinorum TaxID=1664694 RepID=A0A0N1H3F5_9EURO|nr:uncharacterized protein AB675_5062 [Phialophora attinorum]KPI39413.1 hypothetical protein AB675_5062 [Phialophora attinorum]
MPPATESSIAYTEYGQPEGFPVLIVHGWSVSSVTEAHAFEPIFTSLETGAPFRQQHQYQYRRIYPDLPGHGATPSKGIQNLDDIYAHLTSFTETHLSGKRFLLVGSSCGAYLARAVALKYGSQIDGLVLRVPMVEPFNRDLDPFKPIVENTEVISGLSDADKKVFGNQALVQTPEYIQALKATYDNAVPEVAEGDAAVLGPIRSDPSKYKLSCLEGLDAGDAKRVELDAPTLIVCGRQDGVVGYRDSLRLLELYPRSTFAVVDRADHAMPVDDQNDLFGALIRDWLTRAEEWRAHRVA